MLYISNTDGYYINIPPIRDAWDRARYLEVFLPEFLEDPMQLLHIDSSVLGVDSVSRALSAEIVARQAALHPGLRVMHRDLEKDAAQHLSAAHLAAWRGAKAASP